MSITREELALTIDETEWGWLRPHLERGAVILVRHGVDLAEAAYHVASDDSEQIGAWIAEGRLCKPSGEQIGQWDLDVKKRFSMLIVSPYVLIQELVTTTR